MQYRTFGRTGWQVSDIGYGMWGLAGWSGSDDDESSNPCIERLNWAAISSIPPGLMVVDIVKNYWVNWCAPHPDKKLYVASKIPPKNFKWPAEPEYSLDDCYPPDHIRRYVESSLQIISVWIKWISSNSILGMTHGQAMNAGNALWTI